MNTTERYEHALNGTFAYGGPQLIAEIAAQYPPANFTGPMCVDGTLTSPRQCLIGLHPPGNFPSHLRLAGVTEYWQAFARALGDFWLTCPARDQAQWLSSVNRTGGAAPVYLGQWLHQMELFKEFFP